MHSNATKHVFRDLEGMGGINTVKDDKRNDLPVFGDAGEGLQHRKGDTHHSGGWKNCSLDQSKGAGPLNEIDGKTTGGYGRAARSTRLGNITA
jgi:hypothetical protein